MRYDASGNLVRRVQNGYPADSFITQASTNRLLELRSGVDGPRRFIYDVDGSRRSEIDSVGDGTGDRWYFYDGLGRTSGMRVWSSPDDLGGLQFHGGPNSCRYDPLGRQVIACANAAPHLGFDGDNIVRAADWSIVQGPNIDDPLVGFLHGSSGQELELFHVTDGQGRHYATADGTGYLDSDVTGSVAHIGWNATGGSGVSSTFKAERLSGPAAPGLSFFRNRIYDQQTGRWTQEDPIGVAGGVNLYQFNGNNPVAYTDPWGLCPNVTVDGKNIQIDANLVVNGGTPADATAVASGIRDNWSGNVGGYNISVNLNDTSAPTIEVNIQGRGIGDQISGAGVSYGCGMGGKINMYASNRGSATGRLAAHEFGHTLGNLRHAGNARLLMAPRAGQGITGDQIQHVIRECENGKKKESDSTTTEKNDDT